MQFEDKKIVLLTNNLEVNAAFDQANSAINLSKQYLTKKNKDGDNGYWSLRISNVLFPRKIYGNFKETVC